ncbi:uncharacterized protein LOC144714996 [Wolffia australiana]
MRNSGGRRSLSKLAAFLVLGVSLLSGIVRSDQLTGEEIRLPSEGELICPRLPSASACPVTCFRPDPVCGDNGVTYWCGCADAACAGANVAKLGFCEVGNGGSGLLSGQALLLVHLLWLIALAFSVVLGLF